MLSGICSKEYAGRICSKDACSKNISAAHKIKANPRKRAGRGSDRACCRLVGICKLPSKKMLSRWASPDPTNLGYFRRSVALLPHRTMEVAGVWIQLRPLETRRRIYMKIANSVWSCGINIAGFGAVNPSGNDQTCGERPSLSETLRFLREGWHGYIRSFSTAI